MDAAVKQAIACHLGHPAGDILIFMTGQEEIEATCFSLQVTCNKQPLQASSDARYQGCADKNSMLVCKLWRLTAGKEAEAWPAAVCP